MPPTGDINPWAIFAVGSLVIIIATWIVIKGDE